MNKFTNKFLLILQIVILPLLGCSVHRRDLPLLAVPACAALGATAPGAFSCGERAAAERVGGFHGALWSETDWRVLWSHRMQLQHCQYGWQGQYISVVLRMLKG